ncbi:MAG: hypothetical protein WC426_13680 [Sulfuriferula sp.]
MNDGINAVPYPVFLDDHPEMQVGLLFINVEYLTEFDACPPMKTHSRKCDKHGKHLDHYSIPSSGLVLGNEFIIEPKPKVPRG